MARRVRIHADFRRDLQTQLAWLERSRGRAYLERLRSGIEEAIDLIGQFPAAGKAEARDDACTLRKLILRRLPYVIWYVDGPPEGDTWLVRLFHARQDRSRPGAR